MASIRTATIRIVIAAILAAGAALAGAAAVHHAASAGHEAITTLVRPSALVDCCE